MKYGSRALPKALLIAGLAFFFFGNSSADDQGLLPFPLSWDQVFVPPTGSPFAFAPAGSRGAVTAGADGHLSLAGQRIRFWGGNTTFAANFPPKDKADVIARRLASFGVNLVRFHHMDTCFAPEGIWAGAGPDRELDPTNLDRLDYFISRLELAGIYVDINLVVGRPFLPGPGLDQAAGLIAGAKERAVLGFFDAQSLALQKDYAKKLLAHVNPYSGIAYVADPAVAFIEINNENGLIQAYLSGTLDNFPERYRNELAGLWNAFLARRYGIDAGLAKAWRARVETDGPVLVKNGSFAAGASGWNLERHEGAQAEAMGFTDSDGSSALRVRVKKPGLADWHVQVNQGGLALEAGRVYCLSFLARGAGIESACADIGMAHDPWRGLGVSVPIAPAADWRRYELSFALTAAESNARINFSGIGKTISTLEIKDVSLALGGRCGLGEGESLASASIKPFRRSGEKTARSPEAVRDWFEFLRETEAGYWTAMRDYLKRELGAKALIVGTIAATSTPGLQAAFDAVDSHAYWRHPVFPGRPWDYRDWYVQNDPMTLYPANSTMAGIGLQSVKGKPHIVTEYNEPSPNNYEAEALFFLAAYAGLQDLDAVLPFDFGPVDGSADGRIAGYFSTGVDPVKMLSQAGAALAFRRGDIAAARETVTIGFDKAAELDALPGSRSWDIVDHRALGINSWAALRNRVVIDTTAPAIKGKESAPPDVIASDTDELRWDGRAGFVTLDAPNAKWLWGFLSGKNADLGGFRFRPDGNLKAGFCAVALTSLDGRPLTQSRAALLVTLGVQRNTDDQWLEYPDTPVAFPPPIGMRVTHRNFWGKGPALVERVGIKLDFPGSGWKLRALDATGKPVREYSGSAEAGRTVFVIKPEAAFPWYELTR